MIQTVYAASAATDEKEMCALVVHHKLTELPKSASSVIVVLISLR
jgi:hypothetical protein